MTTSSQIKTNSGSSPEPREAHQRSVCQGSESPEHGPKTVQTQIEVIGTAPDGSVLHTWVEGRFRFTEKYRYTRLQSGVNLGSVWVDSLPVDLDEDDGILKISSIPVMKGKSFEQYQAEAVKYARLVSVARLTGEAYTAATGLMRFEFDGKRPSAWSAGYAALLLLQDPDAEPADAERVTALLEAVYKV